MPQDTIRPPGTIEVPCTKCGWHFWIEALHPSLPTGPFTCPSCLGVNPAKEPTP